MEMKEKKLNSWEEFEIEVSAILADLEKKRNETPIYVSSPLFRGHSKESWKLKTTLERYSNKHYSITDYYRILRAIEPAVASFTSKKWNIDPALKIDESDIGPPPRYDFMVYLRHHGFPSPLLDWSCSPYVAAFFAFQPRPEKQDENVAIYSYVEHYGSGKGGNISQAQIIGLGPYIHAHKRHFIQQCKYTICKKLVTDANMIEDNYYYCNHEEAFQRNESKQDILMKYLIPRTERAKVLSKLDFMNINSYSLFVNEESLMETLAYQEIERKNINK
jgi:hypothetical protein